MTGIYLEATLLEHLSQGAETLLLFYEEGSRGAKAIKPYLEKFIGFYTTDG